MTREEFFANCSPEPTTGCWLYVGGQIGPGYTNAGGGEYAHRLAWELWHGPIPPGAFVLHHCDNRACGNAETHLFLGDAAANAADMTRKGRHGRQKLSDEAVAAIKAALASGERPGVLAVRHGVSHALISQIRHGGHYACKRYRSTPSVPDADAA